MLNILKKESADLHYVEKAHPRICTLEEIQKELPDINKLGWKVGDELEWEATTV